jgi:hypothetical protein
LPPTWKVNGKFARVETIKSFRLIEQALDPEDEELTPTMKLKRAPGQRQVQERDRLDVPGKLRVCENLPAPARVTRRSARSPV